MESTKNDISASIITLDYKALLGTALSAVRGLQITIERSVGVLQDITKSNTIKALEANRLKAYAIKLAEAWETYNTLSTEGRDTVTIINLPDGTSI